jgi:soluble lytic murein transglycosylase
MRVPRAIREMGFAAAILAAALAVGSPAVATDQATKSKTSVHKSSATGKTTKTAKKTSPGGKTHKASSSRRATRHKRRPLTAKARAKSIRLHQAFIASSQLRPMAQQLTQFRSPAAYQGVAAYAHSHSGDASATAHLALGHAYLLDHRFQEAMDSFSHANTQGKLLDDYADYLAAQAALQSNHIPEAEKLLNGFNEHYPDSIFVNSVPVLQANLWLQENNPQMALKVLHEHDGETIANHVDFQLALAKAKQMAGQGEEAGRLYKHIFIGFPLSSEAQQAKTQMGVLGIFSSLTLGERRAHVDALYAAGRYGDAADEFRSLAGSVDPETRNLLLAKAAVCDLRTKRLTRNQAEALADTNDEAGAERLYVLMELARNRDDGDAQRQTVAQMQTRFPQSPWLAEALYSSGNMYLLRKDYLQAIEYYGDLARRFPRHTYAPSAHWRAGWLSYRLGHYPDAAKYFDEQIGLYPGGKETCAALYWRGRIFQDQENRPDMAATYYRTINHVYEHYYYGQLARQRLAELGSVAPADVPELSHIHAAPIPELSDDVPEDDPHVVKAKLLANAGLNEYIAPEIAAGDGSKEWGSFAEAEIYASYGETFRAMRVMKRAIPFYTSAPIESIPVGYWRILFPQPYWNTIKEEAAKNGLDPYMVASLIRQETEFNPAAISNKNAYGLMQMIPPVGKSMAKQEGLSHFNTNQLLDPVTNIRLGTRYLRQTLDKFGGTPEYTFAAYNAGDDRVTDWKSIGGYHGIDEFVESIPFTETREYVQAILRNEEIYRALDQLQTAQSSTAVPQSKEESKK